VANDDNIQTPDICLISRAALAIAYLQTAIDRRKLNQVMWKNVDLS
jgi:hypothetical protein